MNKKYLIRIGVLVVIIIIGRVVLNSYNHTNHSSNKTAVNQRAPLPKEVTITLTKNGFSPSQVTIKVDSAARWVNKSGSQETVNSDNYPTNQLHKELNFGIFSNNSSVVHTFTKSGTYGYHNQLNPKQHGEIIVVQ